MVSSSRYKQYEWTIGRWHGHGKDDLNNKLYLLLMGDKTCPTTPPRHCTKEHNTKLDEWVIAMGTRATHSQLESKDGAPDQDSQRGNEAWIVRCLCDYLRSATHRQRSSIHKERMVLSDIRRSSQAEEYRVIGHQAIPINQFLTQTASYRNTTAEWHNGTVEFAELFDAGNLQR